MAARLRRRAPIFAGGRSTLGASVSSPGYMGSVAATLTNTLHQMQFYEQLKNLEKGDPTHFLAVMKPMLGNISKDDPMYAVVKEYVDKAEKYAVTSKADTDAYSAWVKSGNNVAYRDYLQKRADAEQDQTARMGILKDVATLDKRINTGSGGIGNSGITAQDLRDSRDKWQQASNDVNSKLARGESLTQQDLDGLKDAAKEHAAVLTQIENANVSDKARLGAAKERDNKTNGPNGTLISTVQSRSDANLVKNFEGDSGTITEDRVNRATNPGEKARLAGERGFQLQYLAQHMLTDSGREAAGTKILRAEAEVTQALDKYRQERTYDPVAKDKLHGAYDAYLTSALQYNQNNPNSQTKLKIMPEARFLDAVKGSTNAAQLNEMLGITDQEGVVPFAEQDLTGMKTLANSNLPAKWDANTGSFVGTPEQVQEANDTMAGVRASYSTPGNWEAMSRGVTAPALLSDGDWARVVDGTWTAQDNARLIQYPTYSDSSSVYKSLGGGAGSTPSEARGESAPGQTIETPQEQGGRAGLSRPMESGYSDEDWTQTMESADASLTAYKAPDLGEAPPPTQAEEGSLFSNAPTKFDTGQSPVAV